MHQSNFVHVSTITGWHVGAVKEGERNGFPVVRVRSGDQPGLIFRHAVMCEHQPFAVQVNHRHHRFVGMRVKRSSDHDRPLRNRLIADDFFPPLRAAPFPGAFKLLESLKRQTGGRRL